MTYSGKGTRPSSVVRVSLVASTFGRFRSQQALSEIFFLVLGLRAPRPPYKIPCLMACGPNRAVNDQPLLTITTQDAVRRRKESRRWTT